MAVEKLEDDINLFMDHDSLVMEREDGFLVLGLSDSLSGLGRFKSLLVHSPHRDHLESGEEGSYASQLAQSKGIIKPSVLLLSPHHIRSLFKVSMDPVTVFMGGGEDSSIIVVLVKRKLDQSTLLRLLVRAEQTRGLFLDKLGLKVDYSNSQILVACLGHEHPQNISGGSDLEQIVNQVVRDACESVYKKMNPGRNVWEFLEDEGITIDDLVDAGAQLLVGVQDEPSLRQRIRGQLIKSLEDINVISLVMAGIRLEDDLRHHSIAGVNVDDDPAYLFADEVLGMAIANHIAGTKAIFNFKRYDEAKPGIIANLGPVLDDVCAGLVAGCLSKVFEE